MNTSVLVVGATGNLGSRIAHCLVEGGQADLRLLVRSLKPSDRRKKEILGELVARGADLVEGDLTSPETLALALAGVDVVVSAVQGGRDVIVNGQVALAEAAASAGVRRFIPSDFALDLWKAPQGAPMFALRREADAAIEATGLEVVHVLNGAFMDMMIDPNTAGVVDLVSGTGQFYGDGSDEFDLTLVADVAQFTARIAVDATAAPGVYTLSGQRSSFEDVIATVERVTGRTLTRVARGTADDLVTTISAAPSPWAVMGEWYNLSMITTPPFAETSNDRYPDVHPTDLETYLRGALSA